VKNIYELFDNADLSNENLDISETEMTDIEKKRILEMTLKKSGLRKRGIGRKYILPLTAAITIILSFAAVFAQGGLSAIYHRIFGDSIKYVADMGTIIDENYTSNGIKMNIASMVGDENSFYIVAELIKENGETFEDSDYVKFEDLRLNFKSSGGYTWYQIEDEDPSDNKATFIIAGSTRHKIAGDRLTIYARDITEYSIKKPLESFDAYEFLINNPNYISQELTEKVPAVHFGENDYDTTPEEKEKNSIVEKNLNPNYVLPRKYMKIPVERNLRDIYIENIGFADNKLCIRMAFTDLEKYSLGTVSFVNKDDSDDIKYGNFFNVEESGETEFHYYIFDIRDMAELENYYFKYEIMSKLGTTEGEWNINFRADYKNASRTIVTNKDAEINGRNYTVKNIKFSPISINVEMSNKLLKPEEKTYHDFSNSVTVILKDGSEAEVNQSGSSTNALSSSLNVMFKQPIDIRQIDRIRVGSLEVPVDGN